MRALAYFQLKNAPWHLTYDLHLSPFWLSHIRHKYHTSDCTEIFDLWLSFIHNKTLSRNIKHKYHTYMTIKCRLETFNTWLSFIHIIRQCDTSEKNVFQDLWCLIVNCRISCSPWYFFLYILYCILVLLLITAFAMLLPIIRH